MSSTHPAAVFDPHQSRFLDDLPAGLIIMIAEQTDNVWDIASLCRVSNTLRKIISTKLFSKTPFHVMPTSGSISRMARLVQRQHTDPNCSVMLNRVPAVIFENVWPTPADDLGFDLMLTDEDHYEGDIDDEQPYLNTYLRFMDTCHDERQSIELRRAFANTLRHFHGIKEMVYSPGFHKSRLTYERPTVEKLRETTLVLDDHETEDFAEEMWSRRCMMFEPYDSITDGTGAEMFDHGIDAVLRNPNRNDKLKVYITTKSIYALADVDPNATPIPAS